MRTAVPVASVVKIGGYHVLQPLNDLLGHCLDAVALVFILHVYHWHEDLAVGSEIALICNLWDLYATFL